LIPTWPTSRPAEIGQWETGDRAIYAKALASYAGAAFERGREAGRKLTLDDAIAEALASRAE
jgi:hypothetical protein